MSKQGNIQVNSKNLMPVIKKWLYSDKDIFLRELVSNASDAIGKYKKLVGIGEAQADNAPYRIEIISDEIARTLTVKDNGIGMTEEEVEKYIAQVAFSGAEDFIARHEKAGKDGIIGHFGLGFFSAYMVAEKVEIQTLSYQDGAKAVRWVSDGNESYEIEEGTRTARGTEIILHIAEGEEEFLHEHKLEELLEKYCKFMPYEIFLNPKNNGEDTPVNQTAPLWLKDPKECTKEEYEEFYTATFHEFDKPLFWIHINVDYPFRLKGILYFPRSKQLDFNRGEVKLYCNQVFIADNIKEIIPEFLLMLKGTIDCPDIPLNVSRSFLQNDREVQRISRHIIKKVADKLCELFDEDRAAYEGFFNDIAPFVKFGCMKDESFYDRVKSALVFTDIHDKKFTLEEYKQTLTPVEEPIQQEAEGAEKKVSYKIYYVTDPDQQAQYVQAFKENGINALIMRHYIDIHFVSFLEYKEQDVRFLRIDAETPESLKATPEGVDAEKVIEVFKANISDEALKVEAQALKNAQMPAVLQIGEFMRRFTEMNRMYQDPNTKPLAVDQTLVLNLSNPVVAALTEMEEEKLQVVCPMILDLAKIANKPLTAEELSAFIERCCALLNVAAK
ncbi:MAG: molecular chaperone HtpG [Clostridia bacterium]|nr:molecular chaperone HtpG [Clostridia bacterium]